ncbi:MAG: ATP-dependent Lon protease [Gammaproteobacteria bacterium]
MPSANARDVKELPEDLTDGLKIHQVERYPEVAAIIFG